MDHYHCCLDFNFTFPRNLVLLRPAEQWRIYEVRQGVLFRGSSGKILPRNPLVPQIYGRWMLQNLIFGAPECTGHPAPEELGCTPIHQKPYLSIGHQLQKQNTRTNRGVPITTFYAFCVNHSLFFQFITFQYGSQKTSKKNNSLSLPIGPQSLNKTATCIKISFVLKILENSE